MKALILNSGLGTRMQAEMNEYPKCMTEIAGKETIISRQLRLLANNGINEVVVTTGLFADKLEEYCHSLNLPIKFTFVLNPVFRETNYIYSIYMAREYIQDDILLMHGDLVFSDAVLKEVLVCHDNCMIVSSTKPLPEKDFKAVIKDGYITKVGIEFFDNALTAQPLYKLNKKAWLLWLNKINEYCKAGNTKCYAEKALNDLDGQSNLRLLDVQDMLCGEIDDINDLNNINEEIEKNGK